MKKNQKLLDAAEQIEKSFLNPESFNLLSKEQQKQILAGVDYSVSAFGANAEVMVSETSFDCLAKFKCNGFKVGSIAAGADGMVSPQSVSIYLPDGI